MFIKKSIIKKFLIKNHYEKKSIIKKPIVKKVLGKKCYNKIIIKNSVIKKLLIRKFSVHCNRLFAHLYCFIENRLYFFSGKRSKYRISKLLIGVKGQKLGRPTGEDTDLGRKSEMKENLLSERGRRSRSQQAYVSLDLQGAGIHYYIVVWLI